MKRPILPRGVRTALWAVGIQLSIAACVLAAPATTALDNLGDSLLDDELARALSPPATVETPRDNAQLDPASTDPNWLPDEEMIRRLMDQQTGQAVGEDAGASPLESVVRGMRQAGDLLADDSVERPAVPVQRRVVQDLERLIAQMEKQCQGGGQSKKPSKKQKQASQRSKPKPGKGSKPTSQPSKPTQAARSSDTQLGSASAAPAGEPPAGLSKEAWGHLPERVREQMLQASSEEFLPEYREQLEAYYRRLAERESESGR